MDHAGARVLVVEDDATVADVVLNYLRHAGMLPDHAADGPAAVRLFNEAAASGPGYSLVVLDLMLPGISGLDVCRAIRAAADVPVIMLTARGEEEDRVLGLEVGADDYLTKPFSPRELVLRIKSVLRRTQPLPVPATAPAGAAPPTSPATAVALRDGDLVVDVRAHRAHLGSRELALTAREFDLLAFLIARPGEAFSREQLMSEVWQWDFGDRSTVTVHVRRLREKIEADPTAPTRIVTVWGVGYRWEPAGTVSAAGADSQV